MRLISLCFWITVILTAVQDASASEIIHLADYHFVSEEDFAVSVRSVRPKATNADITSEYEGFLKDVDQVQREQMVVIRKLIKEHGLSHVYAEGLTKPMSQMAWVQHLKTPRKPSDDVFGRFMAEQRRRDLLAIGAAGRLYLSGALEDVLPCETEEMLKKADPVRDGKLVLDEKEIEEREAAIVERLLKANTRVVLIVLGAGHDLSDNVTNGVEVRRVEVEGLRQKRRAD